MPRPAACAAALLPPLPGGANMYTTLCFKSAKTNSKGTAPLILRITIAGERATCSTGVRIPRAAWNSRTGKVRSSHPGHSALNDSLQQLLGNAHTAKHRVEAAAVRPLGIAPGAPATAAEVADYLRDPAAALAAAAPKCFLHFCESELQIHYATGNCATHKSVGQAVRRLRQWNGPKPLLLATFGPARATAFYQHLLTTARSKSQAGAEATAALKLRWLTALFNRGRKSGLFPQATSPFEVVTKESGTKRLKGRLTPAQLRELAALPFAPGSPRDIARNVYLLQFYLRGERVGATLLLRRANYVPATGRLLWQAQKRGPEKAGVLPLEARALLAKFPVRPNSPFLLPLLPANYDALSARQRLSRMTYAIRRLNEALDEIGKLAGFAVALRTHGARHTFATVADGATNRNARAVQLLLGHSELRTTEIYLGALSSQEMDDMADSVYSSMSAA